MFRVILVFLFYVMCSSIVIASDKTTSSFFSKNLPFAEFSSVIYEEKPVLEEVASRYEFAISEVNNVPGVEVSYAILTSPIKKQHIIVVRGTANVENVIADMDVKLIADLQTGILLHQGFLQTAKSIHRLLKGKLNKDFDVVTTGHSLGGAVAVILGMQLRSDNFNVVKVVTFGQPKVTNIEGANKYQDLNVIRIVKPKDLVPIVPPVDLLDLKSLNIYWHIGKEIILMKNNEYAELDGMDSMLRGLEFVVAAPNQENLDSHKMAGYFEAIKNNSQKSIKIEYKTSFNPLDLFGTK